MRPITFAVCTFCLFALCMQPAFSSDIDDRLKAIEEKAEKALKEELTPAAWQDLMKSAQDAYKAGRYQQSLKILKQARVTGRNSFAEQKEFILAYLRVQLKLANYAEAKKGYQKLTEGELNPDKGKFADETIEVMNGAAEISMVEGDLANAKSVLELAIEGAKTEKLITENTLTTLLLLADIKLKQTNLSECEKLYTEVNSSASRIGSNRKAFEASALDGLAAVILRKGDSKRALSLAEQAMKLRQEVFGENSLEVATSLKSLADIKGRTDDDAARQLRLRALSLQINALGTTAHPSIADTMLWLVRSFDRPLSEGEHLCMTARHSVDGILGNDAPLHAQYLYELGSIYQQQQMILPALETLQKSKELQTKLYGERCLGVADCLHQMAKCHEIEAIERAFGWGSFEKIESPEAVSCIQKAIEITD